MTVPGTEMSSERSFAGTVAPWVALAARLLLAGVFGYAGLSKVGDPAATVRAVRAYRLLAEPLVAPFAHALPAVEIAVAVLLLLGLAVRLSAAVSSVLLTMFVVGVGSAAARGLRIDCGCFGGGGATAHPHYATELVRDGLLLLVAVGLTVRPRSRFSLDPDRVPSSAVPHHPADGSRAQQRRAKAAAAQAAALAESRSRQHLLRATAAVAVLLLSGVAGIVAASGGGPGHGFPVPTGAAARGGVLVGRAGAPHHLVVFEDPQCPICGQFERTSGAVVEKAVAAGDVQVEYRMRSFLGPESVRADAALGAAQQVGHFAALRTWLFAHQPPERTGGYTLATLQSAGQQIGLTGADLTRYQDLVRSQTYAAWAAYVDDQASKDGNVGTPELRLDGHTVDTSTAFNPQAMARALTP